MTHFHVATGLSGYGPDDPDGYATGETWRDVADLIRDVLRDAAVPLADEADACSERFDYEGYHAARELADALHYMSENLSNSRAEAPLYTSGQASWDDAIADLVERQFPLSISTRGYERLYAWECAETDGGCVHAQI